MTDPERLREQAAEKREKAEALDQLADALADAESIAADCPALAPLFHEARTSPHNSRDGRHVALLDLTDDGWACRQVSFLEKGTHYRDTGADLTLAQSPWQFMSTDDFRGLFEAEIRRAARTARQNAAQLEEHADTRTESNQ